MAKSMTGVVSSDKGDKTIVVVIAARKTHPLYKKQYTHSKKFMAHDETNDAREGDKVVIAESKPISARKRFVLVKVVERAPIRHTEAETSVLSVDSNQLSGQKQKTENRKQITTKPEVE